MGCYIQTLFLDLLTELERVVKEEVEFSFTMSEEDWADMKPTRAERNVNVVSALKASIKAGNDSADAGSCFGCYRFDIKKKISSQLKGPEAPRRPGLISRRKVKHEHFPTVFTNNWIANYANRKN